MNNREQRNYVSHACLINRKQPRICSVNRCETRISWGNKRKKAVKTQVSRIWVPDKPQPSITPASQSHAKPWCSPTALPTPTSGCPEPTAPFSQIQLVSCPRCHAGLWATMLLRGRKMYCSDNIEGLQLPNTLCLCKHLLSGCCSGKSKMKKDSCKSASSSRKLC